MAKRIGEALSGGKLGSHRYVPDAGHLIWLSFSPHTGREQGGRQPALVLSPLTYNLKAGLCVVCRITTERKGYPFEVDVPAGLSIGGVVLSDHVKSVDWTAQGAIFAAPAPPELIIDVKAKLKPLLGI